MKWTNIKERKPVSGEHVLLSCLCGGSQYVCDGFYAAPYDILCPIEGDFNFVYSDEDDEYYLAEGFYEVIKNWDDFSSIAINDTVTHWMPLPKPAEL